MTWIYIARGCCLDLTLMPNFGYTGTLASKLPVKKYILGWRHGKKVRFFFKLPTRLKKLAAGILNGKVVKHYFDLNCQLASELIFLELQLTADVTAANSIKCSCKGPDGLDWEKSTPVKQEEEACIAGLAYRTMSHFHEEEEFIP